MERCLARTSEHRVTSNDVRLYGKWGNNGAKYDEQNFKMDADGDTVIGELCVFRFGLIEILFVHQSTHSNSIN